MAAAIHVLAVTALGVYAGGTLTEGGVLVPWWRGLPPAEFLRWYAANHARITRFFGALTATAAVLAVVDAGVAVAGRDATRGWAVAAAVLMLALVAMFPLCFKTPNERFASGGIAPDDVPAALARWAAWHRLRMVASVVTVVVAARHAA